MSDRLGMILAIHEQPDDDLPRLAYADWLEEHGELDHAEFIRVEVQLVRLKARRPPPGPDRPAWEQAYRVLFQRDIDLIRAHKDEWFGTFRDDWSGYEVRRGFIDEISARSAASVVPHADWLFSHHALEDLHVTDAWAALCPLLSHPLAGVLSRLSLRGLEPGWSPLHSGESLRRGLPLTRRLLVLSMSGHRAGPEIISDLLHSPHLGRVGWLNLSSNAVTAGGLELLLDSMESMPRLTALLVAGRLTENTPTRYTATPNVGPDGIILLANHRAADRLETIDLSNNRISSEGVRALMDSPFLGNVKRLGIGQGVSRADARRLRDRFGDRVDLPREG